MAHGGALAGDGGNGARELGFEQFMVLDESFMVIFGVD